MWVWEISRWFGSFAVFETVLSTCLMPCQCVINYKIDVYIWYHLLPAVDLKSLGISCNLESGQRVLVAIDRRQCTVLGYWLYGQFGRSHSLQVDLYSENNNLLWWHSVCGIRLQICSMWFAYCWWFIASIGCEWCFLSPSCSVLSSVASAASHGNKIAFTWYPFRYMTLRLTFTENICLFRGLCHSKLYFVTS